MTAKAEPKKRLTRGQRLALISFAAFVLAGLIYTLSVKRHIDHDLFHQMALWKARLELGALPKENIWSYTPAVSPHVHHEWGFGAVMQTLVSRGGERAIQMTRDVLTLTLAGLIVLCARRRGATWLTIAVIALPAAMLAQFAVSAVRAQMVTLVFLAALLNLIETDRRGGRWWIAVWIPMYVLWLNLHGGFAVGPAVLALHWLERLIRTRRPQWHLIAVGLAMPPLALLNPYGFEYLRYMLHAVTMPRPGITEWAPIWDEPLLLGVHAFTVLLVPYVAYRRGWKDMPGILILAFATLESIQHIRHVSLYMTIWCAYMPSYLARTPLNDVLLRLWERRPSLASAAFLIMAGLYAISVKGPPFTVRAPANPDDARSFCVPMGAARYLEEIDFRGRLMTPFNGSAYLMWALGPSVKISMDSRYEAAYPEEVFQEFSVLYKAKPGWREVFAKYPPDLVLVPTSSGLFNHLADLPEWTPVYQDEAFWVLAPTGSPLPVLDQRGKRIDPRLPL